jgi:hypothetical protein
MTTEEVTPVPARAFRNGKVLVLFREMLVFKNPREYSMGFSKCDEGMTFIMLNAKC